MAKSLAKSSQGSQVEDSSETSSSGEEEEEEDDTNDTIKFCIEKIYSELENLQFEGRFEQLCRNASISLTGTYQAPRI